MGSRAVKRAGCQSFNNVRKRKADLQKQGWGWGVQNVKEQELLLVSVACTNYEQVGIHQKHFVGQLSSEMLGSVWRSVKHWQLTYDGLF